MKTHIIWITIIIVLSLVKGDAQPVNTDSLNTLKQKLHFLKNDSTQVSALLDIVNAYDLNIDSALVYSFKAAQLAHTIKYYNGEMASLLLVEVILRHSDNIINAFTTANRGLKLAIDYNNHYYQAQFLGELGIIIGSSINFNAAFNYLHHSKELYDSIHIPQLVAYMNNNIGEVYFNKGVLDSAFYYCKACYDAKTSDYSYINLYASINLGKISLKEKNYSNALFYFKHALLSAAFYSHFFDCNLYIAKTYFYLHKPDSCLYYANNAMNIALESKIYSQREQANSFFALVYKKTNPAKALTYVDSALVYKDSSILYNERVTIERFNEFDMLEKQNEIAASKISYQSKVKTYVFIISACVFLIVAFILYKNNRHKQKVNNTLKTTLTELKSTQAQLVQSEKMASLGELTAGIAHEIQNPLNFMNNFSEVNQELISELVDEVDKGNTDEAKAIANDIKDNSEKINHHGKRADAIVKGMLQHSRQTKGIKEPTDINALCDEYLRLSYHGLRAKDKSFNADFKTDFDSSIGKINIVPQDIGRVLLNLFNNAFYAVSEKKKSYVLSAMSYAPMVSIQTKKLNDKIEIRVEDNGNGIPSNIIDKIFQPFFTTKPTGQGTGLGLSLAYDIITKEHNGTIKVESKEGEGTRFLINLSIT